MRYIFYNYYKELQYRIFLIFLNAISVAIVCFYYKNILLYSIISFSNNSKNSEAVCFIFTEVTEVFSVYIELVFFIVFQIIIITVLYHLLIFLSLGLYKTEHKKIKFVFKTFFFYWVFTIMLLNNVLVSLSWSFFSNFKEVNLDVPVLFLNFEAKISEYVTYYISFYYICFFNCCILTLLTLWVNYLSNELTKVKKLRKLFYFIFVILSTITTPPDVFSQVITSFFLIFCYEMLVLLKIFNKTKI